MTTSTVPSKTGIVTGIQAYTWANLPAAAANANVVAFATDLGTGTLVRSNGTRWLPVGGVATLKALGAAVSGVANSETIELQTLLPVNAWQANDRLRLYLVGTKTGTTDAFNLTVRIGTAGTTSDTAITGLSALQMFTASGINGGGIFDIKLVNATSAQKLGANASGVMTYTINSASAVAAATTISDASANALYVSVSIASSGTTNTVGLTDGEIQLITP
jgi:hypothetical protein